MPECVFCKIVAGQLPAYKIWEDERHLAILDIFPNTRGMTLVLTKKHYPSYAFDMPQKEYGDFFNAAQKVAKILEKKLPVRRVAMVMEGMGVDHAHLKLYPMHGLERKFKENFASEKTFFEKYEGYLSTQLGPEADKTVLNELKEQLKE